MILMSMLLTKQLQDLYFFASPDIAPRSSSIVTKGGSNGYACFLKGNNLIYLPPSFTTGYADRELSENLTMCRKSMFLTFFQPS